MAANDPLRPDDGEEGGSMVEDLRSHVVTPNQFFVTSSIRFVGEANYPYSSISPDIDYEVDVVISFSSNYIIIVFAGR